MIRFMYACLGTIAVVSVFTAMNLAMHPVRVETRTVAADPGPPTGHLTGEQLNPQLKGLSCDYWTSSKGVVFRCHP